MDLTYIKKRIEARAKFLTIVDYNTYAPRLVMRVAGCDVSTTLRHDEIQDLKYQTGTDVEKHLKELLINEFISNNNFLTKFIQLENRERNLNQLLNEEPNLGLQS